jgi:hypothetical protein
VLCFVVCEQAELAAFVATLAEVIEASVGETSSAKFNVEALASI